MKIEEFGKIAKEQKSGEAKVGNITFEDLFEAAESFEEDPEVRSDDWILARKFVDWKNLHNLSTEDVKLRIIGFLNSWHCRLPVSDKLAERITKEVEEVVSVTYNITGKPPSTIEAV